MPDSETLSHTKWDGKYQVVFLPQYGGPGASSGKCTVRE
jgi:hypothetical protein